MLTRQRNIWSLCCSYLSEMNTNKSSGTDVVPLLCYSDFDVTVYSSLLNRFSLQNRYRIEKVADSGARSTITSSRAFAVKKVFESMFSDNTRQNIVTTSYGTIIRIPDAVDFTDHGGKKDDGYQRYLKTGLLLLEPYLPPLPQIGFNIVKSVQELSGYLNSLPDNSLLSIDIETRGVNPYDKQNARVACIGLFSEHVPDHVVIIPLSHVEFNTLISDVQKRALFDVLVDISKQKNLGWIGHNLKFDVNYLSVIFNRRDHVELYRYDTMQMCYLLHGKMFSMNLADTMEYYTRYRSHKDGVKEYISTHFSSKESGHYDRVPSSVLFPYLAYDVYGTYLLWVELRKRLENNGSLSFYEEVVVPVLRTLCKIELNGNKIDVDYTRGLYSQYQAQITDVLSNLKNKYYLTEDVVSSSKQLREFLHIFVRKRGKNDVSISSTSEEALKELSSTVPELKELTDHVLEYRSLTKKAETYVKNFIDLTDDQGFIHPQFKPNGTVTGRLSSSDPNFQNIPFKDPLKGSIVSRFGDEGVLVQSDYKGAELRVLANISGDKSLQEDLSDPSKDLHTLNASMMFKKPVEEIDPFLRKRAKNAFFALIYGSTEYGLARQLEIPVEEAKSIIDNFYKHRVKVGEMDKNLKSQFVAGKLPVLINPVGRRIYPILNLLSNKNQYKDVARKLLNYLIQSTSSDYCLIGVSTLQMLLEQHNMKSVIINTVHDSIIVDCHLSELLKVIKLITLSQVTYINQKYNLTLLLDNELEIGPNWYEMFTIEKVDHNTKSLVLTNTPEMLSSSLLSRLARFGFVITNVTEHTLTLEEKSS